MKSIVHRARFLFLCLLFTTVLLLLLLSRISVDAPTGLSVPAETRSEPVRVNRSSLRPAVQPSCATVEGMGEEAYSKEASWKESLRVRWIIRDHFDFHGTILVMFLLPLSFLFFF